MKVRSTATIAFDDEAADEDPVVVDAVQLGPHGPEHRVERREDRHRRVPRELEPDVDVEDEPEQDADEQARQGQEHRSDSPSSTAFRARLLDPARPRRQTDPAGSPRPAPARRAMYVPLVGVRRGPPAGSSPPARRGGSAAGGPAPGSGRPGAGSACRSRRPPSTGPRPPAGPVQPSRVVHGHDEARRRAADVGRPERAGAGAPHRGRAASRWPPTAGRLTLEATAVVDHREADRPPPGRGRRARPRQRRRRPARRDRRGGGAPPVRQARIGSRSAIRHPEGRRERDAHPASADRGAARGAALRRASVAEGEHVRCRRRAARAPS